MIGQDRVMEVLAWVEKTKHMRLGLLEEQSQRGMKMRIEEKGQGMMNLG